MFLAVPLLSKISKILKSILPPQPEKAPKVEKNLSEPKRFVVMAYFSMEGTLIRIIKKISKFFRIGLNQERR